MNSDFLNVCSIYRHIKIMSEEKGAFDEILGAEFDFSVHTRSSRSSYVRGQISHVKPFGTLSNQIVRGDSKYAPRILSLDLFS